MPWNIHHSPLGPLTLIGGANGLQAVHFRGRGPGLDEADRDPAALRHVVVQLDEWFAGRRRHFDVPLDLCGGELRQRVWAALRVLPYGSTTTYGRLAAQLGITGRPGTTAAQQVGWAVGATPTPIIVPCHRVLASDGSLTGYRGGVQRKQALLDFEASDGRSPDAWQPRQLAQL